MIYSKWNVFDIEEGEFFLEGLEDAFLEKKRELVITISNSIENGNSRRKNLFKINFDNPVCYRNICTGDFSKSNYDIGLKGSFCIFSNSDYLDWFHEESFSNYRQFKVLHYRIITEFHLLDILTFKSPTIKFT